MFSGKFVRVYFVHWHDLCLGDPQRMHFTSNLQCSYSSGETQGSRVHLSSLSDFDFSGFSSLAGSHLDGRKVLFSPPC
jgi:hypothetical protein